MKANRYTTGFIAFFAALLCGTFSFAQTNTFYYTLNNQTISLNEVPGKYLVEFPDGIDSTHRGEHPGTIVAGKYYLITDTTGLADYANSYHVFPTYKTAEGVDMYVTRDLLL